MSTFEWILVGFILFLPFPALIYAYIKRRRLFYNMAFTSETVWKSFQAQNKQQAIEYVNYLQEEEDKEDPSDIDPDINISSIN